MARAVGIHLIGDAAAVGGRDHRPHQGEPAGAHRVPGGVEDRLAHDPRRQRRRQLLGRATCCSCRPPRRFISVHAPHISEQGAFASFLRKQGKPVWRDDYRRDRSALDGIEMAKDDLYDRRRASSSAADRRRSHLQRKLRIGASRGAAGRHDGDEGIVSPPDAAGREVLDKGYFEEVDAQLR
jgi:DNA segregation ATPase FtsK/SpoIIIE-like protein